MRATRYVLALAARRRRHHHVGRAVQQCHAFGFDQRIHHECAAGFALAPAAVAAVHEQWRAGEAIADEPAIAPALEFFGGRHARSRTGNSRFLERDVVVFEASVLGWRRGLTPAALRSTRGARLRWTRAIIAAFAPATAAALTLAAQHLHFVGNHVGGVALDPVLVGVLVGAQRALHVHLTPFLQVLARDFGEPAKKLDAMPFGAFLPLAGLLVLPTVRGGDPDGAHRRAGRAVARFRVRAQIADQDDLVDAACHVRILE